MVRADDPPVVAKSKIVAAVERIQDANANFWGWWNGGGAEEFAAEKGIKLEPKTAPAAEDQAEPLRGGTNAEATVIPSELAVDAAPVPVRVVLECPACGSDCSLVDNGEYGCSKDGCGWLGTPELAETHRKNLKTKEGWMGKPEPERPATIPMPSTNGNGKHHKKRTGKAAAVAN